MKRILVTTLLAALSCMIAFTQLGNEWIEYGQQYYKFKVGQDGIFRISTATLTSAGLDEVSAGSIRLYHMGQQVPLYVSTDGILGSEDYVEFVGKMNRGAFDRHLYSNPDGQQLNPYYSMFSDSSSYYLTLTDAGIGERVMSIENDLNDLPEAEQYYMHEDQTLYTDFHFNPRLQPSTGVAYSHFAHGEGFASNEKTSHVHTLNSNSVHAAGDSALLEVRFVSSNLVAHDVAVTFAGDTIFRELFPSVAMKTVEHKVHSSEIGASMGLNIDNLGDGGRTRLAYVLWSHPRVFTFDNAAKTRFTHTSNNTRQYFELNAFDHADSGPVVYDVTGKTRLTAAASGDMIRFSLPANSAERDVFVGTPGTGISEISDLSAISFTDWSGDNTEYLILSSNRLRTGDDQIGAYLDYRSSAAGGNYTSRFYDVDDIYDQFGYGVLRHPQAIRNFAQFVAENWSAAQMVFIVGKGIEYSMSRDCQGDCQAWFYVPTFGTPGADNLLFTLEGDNLPVLPVGRIPVINSDEIGVYLNKVKEHDLVPSFPQTLNDKAWTKNFLHLGGGADRDQQDQILSLLSWMEGIVESSLYGADVTTYSKASTNSTGESNSDLIIDLLEEGVSLVKFFGHSSANTLDFQINNPREWNNKGKYPIFSAMGCSAGQIHRTFRSLSEIFVFEPDAGAIAFIAGSGSQFLNALGTFGGDWYTYLGDAFQSTTLGLSLKEGLRPISELTGFTHVILVEQQTLTGDPAISFYPALGRDYTWDFQSVRTTPDILTTNLDSFDLIADLVNLGVNAPDLVDFRIEQELPNGTRFTVGETQEFIDRYRQTITFRLPMDRRANGANRFYLTADYTNVIPELPGPDAEFNNTLVDENGVEGIDIYILDNRALATHPLEFSIVTEETVELIASSTNAFAKGGTFIMEIDTTAQFDSPLRVGESFSQFGGVIKWQPPVEYIPGTVYYWRVGLDSTSSSQGSIWDNSSFLYNPEGERGWNQSHYFQYLRDDFDGLQVSDNRQFDFLMGVKNVWVQNAVDTGAVERFQFYVDNTNFISFYRPWKPHEAHVFVAVYNPKTGKTLKNPIGGAHGAINPFSNQRPVFPFSTATPESRNSLMTFIEDNIPTGHNVVLYTYQRDAFLDYHPEEWAMDSVQYGKNIFSVIESIYPDSDIRTLQNGSVPYTIFFTKDGEVIQEQIASDFNATINVDANFPIITTAGSATSTLVGPASAWDRIEWDFDQKESQDTFSISVFAVRADLTDTLIADQVVETTLSLTELDVAQYPFLRLELNAADPADSRSAPQLQYWRVLYEGQPEFVYNPTLGFEFHHDTLPFGDSLHFMSIVENVSPYPAEPFELQYQIVDRDNGVVEAIDVVPALGPGDMAFIEFKRQMAQNKYEHRFIVELNADKTSAEVHHFNNFGLREFYVMPDQTKPQLDVTFDGRHLPDGDVISAQPKIVVALKDENAFLPVSDRDHFELYIKAPGSFDFEEIDLNGPDIFFTPSDPLNGVFTASITWRPTFIDDGFYTFKTNVEDASGNIPIVFYEVNFEILERQRVANVEVSPNPFRSQVRFNFALTGHTPPEHFKVYITDVAGKTVRVLEAKSESAYVGSHLSDIVWDGTDENGSPVSAGIYFYRIEAKDVNGQEYLFEFLNNDVGKLVLLR